MTIIARASHYELGRKSSVSISKIGCSKKSGTAEKTAALS